MAQPRPEGQQPQVDILGARQSIDMLAVLADKTKGNLTPEETRLLDSALFELPHGLPRDHPGAGSLRRGQGAGTLAAPGPVGPSIVR